MTKPIVILMDGLGCDSSTIGHLWATRPETRRLPTGETFDLDQLIVLTSQTGNEWWHTAYLNETYKYPIYAAHGIRTVQIMRATSSTTDGIITLNDTRTPTRCYVRGLHQDPAHPLPPLDARVLDFIPLPEIHQRFPGVMIKSPLTLGYSLGQELLTSGTVPQYRHGQRHCSDKFKQVAQDHWVEKLGYSLGEDLLTHGVVPQYTHGRRKCSDKAKRRPCNHWLEALTPIAQLDEPSHEVPLVYVAIGFTKGEEKRRQRGDMAKEHRSKRTKPPIQRIDFFPLMDHFDYTRHDTEAYAHHVIAQGIEPWWRSACVECPFSGIAGAKEEVLMKHRQYPVESGFALLIEQVSRRLNPRQTLYPNGRSLYQMLADDGNYAALTNLQERLEALPWAVYRVQRVVGLAVPWRCTQLLAVEDYWRVEEVLGAIAHQLRVETSTEPDGFTRAWIEQQYLDGVRVEDLLTIAPAVVRENHRPGWDAVWHRFHPTAIQLSLL